MILFRHILAMLFVGTAMADSPLDVLSKEFTRVLAGQERAVRELSKGPGMEYLEALKNVREVKKQKRDLRGVIAVKEEVTRFTHRKDIGLEELMHDEPAVLRAQQKYRSDVDRIAYQVALKTDKIYEAFYGRLEELKKQLTREDQVEDALKVETRQEAIKNEWAAVRRSLQDAKSRLESGPLGSFDGVFYPQFKAAKGTVFHYQDTISGNQVIRVFKPRGALTPDARFLGPIDPEPEIAHFDRDFYLEQHPEIAKAIRQGHFKRQPIQHYQEVGRNERRLIHPRSDPWRGRLSRSQSEQVLVHFEHGPVEQWVMRASDMEVRHWWNEADQRTGRSPAAKGTTSRSKNR